MRQPFPPFCCLLLAFAASTCSAQSSHGGTDSPRSTAADTAAPRPGWRRLSPVVISAGEFSINETRRTVLKPMDIMTTAGANADVIQVLQTLPGTQQAGANTGLFVRGGDAAESLVIIDGLVVQNPFFSSLPGVSQSSRFSPFQFKGLSFSSGGYSVRYGQALSSILELNTRDLAESSKISDGLNATGIFASGALLRKNSSFEASGYYNNLSPFYHWANSNLRFYHPPSGPGLSLKYSLSPTTNQLLKIFVRGAGYRTGLVTPDPFRPGDSTRFGLDNRLWYAAATYKRSLPHKWDLSLASAYSNNRDNISWQDSTPIPLVNKDYRLQLRAETRKYFSSGCELVTGVDFQRYGYARSFDTVNGSFAETLSAGFAELSWRPFSWLAFRPGLRYEYSALTRSSAISPRLSFALRSGQYAQFALAAGL
ncbi:MAG TPA: TonB-dependent receptor, partial [Puia sp.]|nr:TonB-dependent receptor [Puia sp.]